MDLTKLTAAPWASVKQIDHDLQPTGEYVLAFGMKQVAMFKSEDDCDFAELARNAFDVMMRRGWTAKLCTWRGKSKWIVVGDDPDEDERGFSIPSVLARCDPPAPACDFADPFTALVAADEWYKANVEGD